MIKKKYINFFVIFLLTLLLGLFSTSYAYSYRITDSDCDLIINYVVTTNYSWKSQAKTRLKTMVNNVYNNGWDTCVIALNNQNYFDIAVYGFNASSVTSVNDSKNVNYMGVNTSNSTNIRYYCSPSGMNMGSISSSTWQNYSNFGSGSQIRTRYLVVPNDLGNNLFSGPWQSAEVLTFAPSEIFVFTRNNNLQYVNNGNIAIVDTTDRLGDVQQGHNYGAVEVSCNYWDKARNSWVEFYWFANANNDNSDTVDIYISDFVNSSNNNIFPNVLVQTIYHSNNPDEFETDYFQPFIISDSHTVISGDTFVPTDTFDDDSYYNDYMNTINSIKDKDNTDKITDTLTDDSQVDNIIGSYLSGDIDTYAHDFGFTPLDNPFTTFLLYVLEGTYDTLTRSGNVTLSANYKNFLNFELKSQDFVSPESPLKTFIRMMLITWYLYGNYKFFHHLITLVEIAKIDRAVAELGTDEFYDTDIM